MFEVTPLSPNSTTPSRPIVPPTRSATRSGRGDAPFLGATGALIPLFFSVAGATAMAVQGLGCAMVFVALALLQDRDST